MPPATLDHGFGKHIWVLGDKAVRPFFKILYFYDIFYYCATTTVKFSMSVLLQNLLQNCIAVIDGVLISLAFYRRIFPVAELRIVLLVATSFTAGFRFSSILTASLQW